MTNDTETITTGDRFYHEHHGDIEVVGFASVSDEIEINELERDSERHLDVVCSVQTDYVDFIDGQGREGREPLPEFYDNVNI